jgi:conjugal transfer/entry exclusion protein
MDKQGEKDMTVVDMAKAHLQNVVQRIEELTKQQTLIQNEIEQLKNYVQNGVKDVQVFEESNSNEEGD